MSQPWQWKEDCRRCGADSEYPCVDKNGKSLPPSLTHKVRKEDAGLDDGGEKPTELSAAEKFSVETVGKLSIRPDKVPEQEDKIKSVLWAINFARDYLKVSQETLDRNLAEMIVDGIDK